MYGIYAMAASGRMQYDYKQKKASSLVNKRQRMTHSRVHALRHF